MSLLTLVSYFKLTIARSELSCLMIKQIERPQADPVNTYAGTPWVMDNNFTQMTVNQCPEVFSAGASIKLALMNGLLRQIVNKIEDSKDTEASADIEFSIPVQKQYKYDMPSGFHRGRCVEFSFKLNGISYTVDAEKGEVPGAMELNGENGMVRMTFELPDLETPLFKFVVKKEFSDDSANQFMNFLESWMGEQEFEEMIMDKSDPILAVLSLLGRSADLLILYSQTDSCPVPFCDIFQIAPEGYFTDGHIFGEDDYFAEEE